MITQPAGVIPMVIESGARGERAFDIYSLLLKERIVMLGMPINDQVANLIVAQLLWLSREDPEREIQMYINSPGGQIYAGLALYDTMQMIPAPVHTYAVGMTACKVRWGSESRWYPRQSSQIHKRPFLTCNAACGQETLLP